jgi:hypothetical protein
MLQRLEKRTKQVKQGKTSTAEPEESCFEYVTNKKIITPLCKSLMQSINYLNSAGK